MLTFLPLSSSQIVRRFGPIQGVTPLDRPTAMRIFEGIYRYALTGEGDVKSLQGKHGGKLRLRLGDYRVFFRPDGHVLRILAVKNRKDAYRG